MEDHQFLVFGAPNHHHHQQQQQEHSQLDPSMRLRAEERTWALQVKQAVKDHEELLTMSDMEYAHHAIVARGNVDQALGSIQGVQTFRQEYGLNNDQLNVEQGVHCIQRFLELQPGCLLDVDSCAFSGETTLVFAHGAFVPSKALAASDDEPKANTNWKIHILGCYYLLQVLFPDLRSVRDGVIMLFDASNLGWDNFSMAYERRVHDEVFGYYPFRTNKLMVYNASPVAVTIWSLLKPLLTHNQKTALEMGCQLDEYNPEMTLSDMFLQPSLQQASANVLQKAKGLLAKRARNQETFSLE